MTPNIADIIRHHVSLEVRCLDRLYLHAYMPKLQTVGGPVLLPARPPGAPDPVPRAAARPRHDALRRRRGTRSRPSTTSRCCTFESAGPEGRRRRAVPPRVHRPRRRRRHRRGPGEGAVLQGAANADPGGGVTFDFSRQWVYVKHYYFYVHDREWGPGFLKICTYLPYPVKLCLNGHEWVKQQLRRAGLAFESLDNGFLACADPEHLQTICDQLGPADVQAFFDRWSQRLPWPLTAADRARRLRPSARHLPTRSQPHPGL